MATKISELNAVTTIAGDDLLLVVDNPSGSNVETKKVTMNSFVSSIDVLEGTNITANVSGNRISIATSSTPSFTKVNFSGFATPANSSYVNSTFTYTQGDMFCDTNSVYIAVSNTEIKKVDLAAIT